MLLNHHCAMESFNSYFWYRNKCIHPFKIRKPCQLWPVYVMQIHFLYHVPFFHNCQVTAVFQVSCAYQVNNKLYNKKFGKAPICSNTTVFKFYRICIKNPIQWLLSFNIYPWGTPDIFIPHNITDYPHTVVMYVCVL